MKKKMIKPLLFILILALVFALGVYAGPEIRQRDVENLMMEVNSWRYEGTLNKLIEENGLSDDPEIKAIKEQYGRRAFEATMFGTKYYTELTVMVYPKLTPEIEKLLDRYLARGRPYVTYEESNLYYD